MYMIKISVLKYLFLFLKFITNFSIWSAFTDFKGKICFDFDQENPESFFKITFFWLHLFYVAVNDRLILNHVLVGLHFESYNITCLVWG